MKWDNVQDWVDKANEGKEVQQIEPRWSFDCGLKLDFDGGLLTVSSRFYQIDEDIYDGSVSFLIGDAEIFNRDFSCRHIDVMKVDVEKYVKAVTEKIRLLCDDNIVTFVVGKNEF